MKSHSIVKRQDPTKIFDSYSLADMLVPPNFYRFIAIAHFAFVSQMNTVWATESTRLVVPKIVFGQGNETCLIAARVVGKTPNWHFWNDKWRDQFGSLTWHHDSFPTVTSDGKNADVNFVFVVLDLDNNGKKEVIVIQSDLLSSIEWDWLYTVESKQFRTAQKEGRVGKLLNQWPMLNPQNSVTFSNGNEAIPTSLHIWQYKNTNYILLKEHFFAKESTARPNSFVVAKLKPNSIQWNKQTKRYRLVPELTCQIVAS
jgi:hypothetical protein